MIDIHMIDSGRWTENLQRQADRIRHPLVSLHIAKPVWGNLLQARYDAYTLGSNPYVSWIDDDDEVLDVTWLEAAVNILEKNLDVAAVYPRWVAYDGTILKGASPTSPWSIELARRSPPVAHHLTVMRRKHVLPLLKQMIDGVGQMVHQQDWLLTASLAQFGRLQLEPTVAYRWNLLPGTARTLPDAPTAQKWAVDFREKSIDAYYSSSFSSTRNIDTR